MKKSMISTTEKREVIALLAAFCMFLSIIEYLIPKPLPFMRIGLANLPVLISLVMLKPQETLLLVALKILGQGFVNGTLFSYIFLFSAAGSFASGIVMLLSYRLLMKHITMIGICVLGAMASNLVQLYIASHIIFGKAAYLIGPPFLVVGIISAVILGWFAEKFIDKSLWLEKQSERWGL